MRLVEVARWVGGGVRGWWRKYRWWVAGLAATAVLATLGWWLLTERPRTFYHSAYGSSEEHKKALDIENRALTSGAQIFLGLVLVVGAYLTFRRVRALEKQADSAHQGQLTERFTRATEQLGSKTPAICLGGIYALERIARDSERDHPQVMEVLCAFVREETRREPEESSQDEPENEDLKVDSPPSTTVQAALDVIGRNPGQGTVLNLAGVVIPKAELSGADLAGANLNRANLRRATLSFANLSQAKLRWADLRLANLHAANLQRADLEDANLQCATLFYAANLMEAGLQGAKLMEANLMGTNFKMADFSCANLEKANLSYANLEKACLYCANLAGADLSGANLGKSKLGGASLLGVDLNNANLRMADSWEPFVEILSLSGDVKGGKHEGANFSGANFLGANFLGAKLLKARGLTRQQIEMAIVDESTQLPEGLLSEPSEGG